jgi:hypothetical protein
LKLLKPSKGTLPVEVYLRRLVRGLSPQQRLRILKIRGTWYANEYNELCFEAAGTKGEREKYTFKGSWKINKNHEIEYLSEDGRDTLSFKGSWRVLSASRLVYAFEGSSTSRFEFRACIESLAIYPRRGKLCYRVGIGVLKSRRTLPGNLLTFFGEWKFSRNLGLSFEVGYGKGRVTKVEFGATATFAGSKVILTLRDEFGKPLGLTLTLTHKLFKTIDAEAFVRLKSIREERSVEAGITIPF